MRVIPNENSWIAFTPNRPAVLAAPTESELAAAIVLTGYVVTINPTSTGNAIPTPALDSLFDSSTIGTSQGAFSGDFYRDDVSDLAWNTLIRGTRGYFFICRFGGTGTAHQPMSGQKVEVWPVAITQRAGSAMASNTVQTFTLTAAVPEKPSEDAVVASGTGLASAPLNLVVTPGASGVVVADWDIPLSAGGTPITGYKLWHASTLAGAYTQVSVSITIVGTTATVTGVTPTGNAHFYKVSATNTAGDSPFSNIQQVTVT